MQASGDIPLRGIQFSLLTSQSITISNVVSHINLEGNNLLDALAVKDGTVNTFEPVTTAVYMQQEPNSQGTMSDISYNQLQITFLTVTSQLLATSAGPVSIASFDVTRTSGEDAVVWFHIDPPFTVPFPNTVTDGTVNLLDQTALQPLYLSAGDTTTGLIAHYPFEEGSGVTTADQTGNHPAATLFNIPTWTTGKIGHAISFTPYDYIDTGNWNVTGSALTLAAWIKPNNLLDDERIISKASDSAELSHTFALSADNGTRPRFRLKTGEGAAAKVTSLYPAIGTGFASNQWMHVAGVYDGATMKLYQDGVQIVSVAKTGTISQNNDPVWIGANPDDLYMPFKGIIDDVRVYNRAFSATDIHTLYQETSLNPTLTPTATPTPAPPTPTFAPGDIRIGMVAHYNFDEGSGIILQDVSGHGNDGTFGLERNSGGDVFHESAVPGWTTGKYGSGLSFDGNDYVDMGDKDDFDFSASDSFSVTAWFNDSEISSYEALVSKKSEYTDSNAGWDLRKRITSGVTQFSISDGAHAVTSQGANNGNGQWHFITAVVDRLAQLQTLYVDGMQVDQDSTGAVGDLSNGQPVRIGSYSGGSRYYVGLLDEVRIFRRALTIEEVNTLYQGITPTPTFKPGDTNNDQEVDNIDLNTLITNFNLLNSTWDKGDFDNNGVVNILDLSILLSNFGN